MQWSELHIPIRKYITDCNSDHGTLTTTQSHAFFCREDAFVLPLLSLAHDLHVSPGAQVNISNVLRLCASCYSQSAVHALRHILPVLRHVENKKAKFSVQHLDIEFRPVVILKCFVAVVSPQDQERLSRQRTHFRISTTEVKGVVLK